MDGLFGLDLGRDGTGVPVFTHNVKDVVRNSLLNWVYSDPVENYGSIGEFGLIVPLVNKSLLDLELKRVEKGVEEFLYRLPGIISVKVDVSKKQESVDINAVYVYETSGSVEEYQSGISIVF